METGFTSTLAHLVSDTSHSVLSGKAMSLATTSILDTLAAAVAGSVEPAATIAQAAFLPSPARDDTSPLLWLAGEAAADHHALVLGAAAHALDYDDVIMRIIAHPSAPILCALIPLLRRHPVSGREFVTAFTLGTEVMVRVGDCMGFHHFALGFHSTATLGTVGAAAACARLLGLDHAQSVTALALAASMASGVRANFGSMVKPLHVGLAASSGLRAAQLAAAGYSAATEAYEGDEGFLSAYSGGQTLAAALAIDLETPVFAVESPGFSLKRYPCCYMTHKLIKGALMLRREGLRLEDVRSLKALMPQGGTKPLIHPQPRNGLHAKFSGPYTIAAALHDGRVDFTSFIDSEVLRPAIQERLPSITLEERGDALRTGGEVGDAPITLIASLHTGEQKTVEVGVAPGSPEDPLSAEELRAKWLDCFAVRARSLGASQDVDAVAASFDGGLRLHEYEDASLWLDGLSRLFQAS